MEAYERILLVADPALRESPAIERAAQVARATGAELHLGLFDHHAGIAAVGAVSEDVMSLARSGFVRERADWLAAVAARLAGEGLRVHSEVVWGKPVHEQIIARAARLRADLVVKDVRVEAGLRRLLYTPLDWQLLRLCPQPLLLVNGQAHPLPRRVIAAVDTGVLGEDAEALNDAILGAARQLADQCRASLHLAHAFDGLGAAPLGEPHADGLMIREAYTALRALRREHFDGFAGRHGIAAAAQHFLEGNAADALAELADTAEADVLAVGAVHREGLERLLLGSTAERILERLHCDVLVVKPPAFWRTLIEHLELPEDLLPPFPA